MSKFLNQDFGSEEEDDEFQAEENEDVDGENEPDDEEVGSKPTKKSKVNRADEEQDEEDEDDEEDDEEDEDEEDEADQPQRKRARKKKLQFFDIEAEVDEDEEDEEDDEDLVGENGFIEQADEAGLARYQQDDHRHRELDRQFQAADAQGLQDIAAGFVRRHGRSAGHRSLDSRVVPRKLLLPSVSDPNIWGVKCKPGKEREIIFNIMKKCEDYANSKTPLAITAAFERGGGGATMSGYIYVEAAKQSDVMAALNGIRDVYPMTKMILVPIKEMPDLLNVVKKAEITPGMWVRYKRGKYIGDLAQVENVSSNGLELRIRMVPRIDYGGGRDTNAMIDSNDPNKRKRGGFGYKNSAVNRPPQRLFSENEAKANLIQSQSVKVGKKCFVYAGEEYEDGYLVKDVKLSAVTTENVNPTLEEVTKFASGAEDGTEALDLNALAASLKQNTNSAYQPGDMVEVYDGEQQGVVGKAVMVQGDIVSIDVTEGDLKGTRIEVPFKGLRKRFKEGDHVKVTGASRYKGEVGMVVRIVQDKVTILSDMTMQEITVFSKDLRDAVETVGGAPGTKYDLHDLVQLDPTTVACVTKVDRESIRVLDQNGNTRVVMPSQISTKIDNRRLGVATDRNGSEIRVGDTVKEVIGEAKQGTILHIFRSYLFLHNRGQTENAGVFVTRSSNVATIMAKGGRVAQNTGPDLTKMNPAMQRGGPGKMGPPTIIPKQAAGRDKIIGQHVTVRIGIYKGLIGIVKDANDTMAKVELHSRNKPVNIERTKLGFKDSATGAIQTYEQFMGSPGRRDGGSRGGFGLDSTGNSTPREGWTGSRTPVPDFQGSRTPAWMGSAAGARTPAWMSNDGGRTPAYGGSRTPAWNDGSRSTYGGGNRTPAWNPGSRTPYVGSAGDRGAWDAGSKTPGRPNDTNGWGDSSSTTSSAKTPGASGFNATSPDFSASATPYNSAPTPGGNLLSAPTPGFSASAPTPAAMSAPTPAGYSAPTPAAYTAPTPGASHSSGRDPRGNKGFYEGAPTPAAGGGYSSARTPGVWGGGEDDTGPGYSTPSP